MSSHTKINRFSACVLTEILFCFCSQKDQYDVKWFIPLIDLSIEDKVLSQGWQKFFCTLDTNSSLISVMPCRWVYQTLLLLVIMTRSCIHHCIWKLQTIRWLLIVSCDFWRSVQKPLVSFFSFWITVKNSYHLLVIMSMCVFCNRRHEGDRRS